MFEKDPVRFRMSELGGLQAILPLFYILSKTTTILEFNNKLSVFLLFGKDFASEVKRPTQ